MYDTLIPQFEQQLQKRKSHAEQMLYFQMGLSIAIVLLVGYLASVPILGHQQRA